MKSCPHQALVRVQPRIFPRLQMLSNSGVVEARGSPSFQATVVAILTMARITALGISSACRFMLDSLCSRWYDDMLCVHHDYTRSKSKNTGVPVYLQLVQEARTSQRSPGSGPDDRSQYSDGQTDVAACRRRDRKYTLPWHFSCSAYMEERQHFHLALELESVPLIQANYLPCPGRKARRTRSVS